MGSLVSLRASPSRVSYRFVKEDFKMKATIFCRPTDKGVHTFYLNANGTEYYLFHQNYRKGVSEYYSNGVSINEAINFGRSKKDDMIAISIFLKTTITRRAFKSS